MICCSKSILLSSPKSLNSARTCPRVKFGLRTRTLILKGEVFCEFVYRILYVPITTIVWMTKFSMEFLVARRIHRKLERISSFISNNLSNSSKKRIIRSSPLFPASSQPVILGNHHYFLYLFVRLPILRFIPSEFKYT